MSSEPGQVEVGSAAGEQGAHAHTCRGFVSEPVVGSLSALEPRSCSKGGLGADF